MQLYILLKQLPIAALHKITWIMILFGKYKSAY